MVLAKKTERNPDQAHNFLQLTTIDAEAIRNWINEHLRAYDNFNQLEQLADRFIPTCEELSATVLQTYPVGTPSDFQHLQQFQHLPKEEGHKREQHHHQLPDVTRLRETLTEHYQNAKSGWSQLQEAQQAYNSADQHAQQQQAAWQKIQLQGEELESSLLQSVQDLGLADLATVEKYLLPEQELLSLREQIQQLEHEQSLAQQAVSDAQQHCKNTYKRRCNTQISANKILHTGMETPSNLSTNVYSIPTYQDQQDVVRVSRQAHDQLAQQSGAIQQQLQRDQADRARAAEHEELLKARQSDYAMAERLNKLIGHNKGERFREYAQTLTLDQLVHYANHRLAHFKPRYRLATRAGLQLDVIDHHQADQRRPAATLSGGESFLISLALALGLADFRRGKGAIKSVFIDEGFGSLDGDSLESALNTLELVQHHIDAQIIVISHVGELQQRWQEHIHVKHLGQGKSWLVLPHGPSQPPQVSTEPAHGYQPRIDTDRIATFLQQQGRKQTRAAIAKALAISNDQRLAEALKNDDRFILDGRSWLSSERQERQERLTSNAPFYLPYLPNMLLPTCRRLVLATR